MQTTFQLNWLRETGCGHLEIDLGTTVPSPRLELAIIGLLPEQQPGKVWDQVTYADLKTPRRLPDWARRTLNNFFGADPKPHQLTLVEGFCNRIRDKAWKVERANLFLPYVTRREWSDKFSLISELGFSMTRDGIVAQGVKPQSLRDILLRTASAAFSKSPAHAPLRFQTSTPLIAPWRNMLLERYGLDLPNEAPALAQFSMDSSGIELASWLNTPRERHCHYYSVFSKMAMALQYSLRRWTLATFALGPDALADFDNGADVLAYSAVRPHAEKRARDFSYDVLNPEMMDFAFGRAERRLEPLLQCAHDSLILGEHPFEARQYLRRDVRLHATRLAVRARRRSRVRQMLVSEGVLIYSLIKFANRLKLLDSARAVNLAVDELTHDFEDRIRRMFFFLDKPQDLGTLIFMEASNGIHCALGGDQAMTLQCETTDGIDYNAIRPITECLAPI